MTQAALAFEPDNYYTDIPVGEILRRARLHYGQSLTDIERNLRIRSSLIEAIEKGDSSKLPGRVYAVGFVRSYAEYLGLNGEKMVQLFKVQSVGVSEKPELNFPAPASDSKVPSFWLVGGSLAAAFVLIIGWGIIHAVNRSDVTEVTPVPQEMADRLALNGAASNTEPFGPPAPTAEALAQAAATSSVTEAKAPPSLTDPDAEATTAAAASEKATTPVVPAEPGIILNIVENSWVEVKDGTGRPIVSRVLKAGDQYFVPDRPGLTMSIGNAGGVELIIDGKTIPPIGKTGEIRRNIPLNSKAFKAPL